MGDETVAETMEKAAGKELGVKRWDRPTIFRESADSATDNSLPYWLVLVLSGAIATLGLALNSSAVVIGAMLVAPLLAPVIGLALSLAVGDGRLAVQTAAVVLGSTAAVVLVGAALTALLPFHTVTVEISARTRPTTLDLVIAVFSGLVGAVVTVARGSRLSAAIPGVAISVALIPPLAVAGFGVGVGWNLELIRGSLLLYGANLAGIVLSGMGVFLLVGMHRDDVVETARRWHGRGAAHGLADWAGRARWVRSMGVFRSAWARLGLVLSFAVALGIPLSESLEQIAREARVERAVSEAAEIFDAPGHASLLGRQVVYGAGQAQIYLRVATTQWFDAEDRERFERRASAMAGEPVRLSLEQLPARGEDLDQLAALLPGGEPRAVVQPPAPPPLQELEDVLASARARVAEAVAQLVLPAGVDIAGAELSTTTSGRSTLRAAYAAAAPLPPPAEQMVRRQLARSVRVPDLGVELVHLSTAALPVSGGAVDSAGLAAAAEALRRYPRLLLEVTAPSADGRADELLDRLVERGIPRQRIRLRSGGDSTVRLRSGDPAAAPDAQPPAAPAPGS